MRAALYYATGVDLTAVEGIDAVLALTLVSELGTDFTQWPTVKHFASWLGLCPNWKKTGGKVKSSRTRRGKNRAAALRLAAWGLMKRPGRARGKAIRRNLTDMVAHLQCHTCSPSRNFSSRGAPGGGEHTGATP